MTQTKFFLILKLIKQKRIIDFKSFINQIFLNPIEMYFTQNRDKKPKIKN